MENVRAWYDGSRGERDAPRRGIPLAARMIAIVEAFDAMTTDHVYRPAMSQERAMAELFHCAGTQFDPELVRQFAEFRECGRERTAPRGGRPLAGDARSGDGQLLLGATIACRRRPLPPSGRRRVPGQAAGQHVRRGGVHRRDGQDHARGTTARSG